MSTKSKGKSRQIEWRRGKIVELKAKGLSQLEIARELQLSESTISVDMQYLREQAKASIKEYVTERLPSEYQICLAALDAVIKRSFQMVETSNDQRVKLQAMEVFKDAHLCKVELLSGSTTIDAALEYIKTRQREQEQQEETTATTTTSGKQTVF